MQFGTEVCPPSSAERRHVDRADGVRKSGGQVGRPDALQKVANRTKHCLLSIKGEEGGGKTWCYAFGRGVGVGVACRASVCRGQVSRVVGFGEQELKLLS